MKSTRIVLNARGTKFEILLKSIATYSIDSRLGKLYVYYLNKENLFELCDDLDLDSLEFYFNRDPEILKIVLNYHSTGQLHVSKCVCPVYVKQELEYWMIDAANIYQCCRTDFDESISAINEHLKEQENAIEKLAEKDIFDANHLPELRKKIWNILERPDTSKIAKVTLFFKLFQSIFKSYLITKGIFYHDKFDIIVLDYFIHCGDHSGSSLQNRFVRKQHIQFNIDRLAAAGQTIAHNIQQHRLDLFLNISNRASDTICSLCKEI